MQQFIGTTKRYKAVETLAGEPSTDPLPCKWTTDDAEKIALAPVSPNAAGESLECDVTAVAGFGPANYNLIAKVASGPQGVLGISTVFPFDAVTIVQE